MNAPSTPSTPSKKRGGLNDILAGLNVRWGFDLPIRNSPESPSRSGNRGSLRSKVASRIAFLFFKDLAGLKQTIETFEEHAEIVYSEWVFKPHGEIDTVPRRASAACKGQRRAFPFERALSASETDTLLRSLSDLLNKRSVVDVKPCVPQVSQYREVTSPLSEVYSTNLSYYDDESDMAPPKQTQISSYSGRHHQETPLLVAKNDPYSSEDFGSWPADEDIDMIDAAKAKTGTSSTSVSTDDEEFNTPPEEPLQDATLTAKSQLFEPLSERVPLIHQITPPTNRKRPSNSNEGGFASKKSTRCSPGPENHFVPVMHYNPVVVSHVSSRVASASTSFTSTATTTRGSREPTTTNTSFGSFYQGGPASPKPLESPNANVRKKFSDVSLQDTCRIEPKSSGTSSTVPAAKTIISPSQVIDGLLADDYFRTRLYGEQSSFFEKPAPYHEKYMFRLVYEVTRVSQCTGVAAETLFDEFARRRSLDLNDLGDIYSALSHCVSRRPDAKRLPARSPVAAWNKADGSFERVTLGGDLLFSEESGQPMMKLQLKPLKIDKSYRLSRKYGGDRILVIGLPALEPGALPNHLKPVSHLIRDKVVQWLFCSEHACLGRIWKALFVKKADATTKAKKENRGNLNAISHQVFFFAIDGIGFVGSGLNGGALNRHSPVKLSELLKWFMPFKTNREQPLLKLFARLQLAVSSTTETQEFQLKQIVRRDDVYSCLNPGQRRLNIKRSDAKKSGKAVVTHATDSSEVMDDGCARISFQAAKQISALLNLDYVPSAFQGRIAGAKGMWMVDYTQESIPTNVPMTDSPLAKHDLAVWIEITDSQLKFNCPETEGNRCVWTDKARRTFEVNAYSTPLKPATLNFQLMSILTEQGIPRHVFERLLREDLTTKTSQLKAAMNNSVALRVWNQENSPVGSRRTQAGGVEWLGGLPNGAAEQINCLVEHGFEPKECQILYRLCYEETLKYSSRLSERMHIGLGRSTYAFMLADPFGVLEENEIHFGFSNCFQDPKSGFADTMLDGVDVLVARLPASLPSDVQKVNAVFKSQLARYKDVIVFPIRGKMPLAAKLSGGDYDGDKAWVCWDPTMVDNFCNCDPPEARHPGYYGITKSTQKVKDVIQESGEEAELTKFLEIGFSFALQPSLLGIVTTYYESFLYHLLGQGSAMAVKNPKAIEIAMLLGLLVDSTKCGSIFGFAEWNQFKVRSGLPAKLPRPAFLNKGETKPNLNHVVDYLIFEVTSKVVKEELGDFIKQYQKEVNSWDSDLFSVLEEEEKLMNSSQPELKPVLDHLKQEINTLCNFWAEGVPSSDEEKCSSTFAVRAQELRTRFLAIKPPQATQYTGSRWSVSALASSTLTAKHWELLKASMVFTRYTRRENFVWYACGKELCEIKAMRVGDRHENKETHTGGLRNMVKTLHEVFKPDARMVKRMEDRDSETVDEEVAAGEMDEDYGTVSDEFFSVLSDIGYFST